MSSKGNSIEAMGRVNGEHEGDGDSEGEEKARKDLENERVLAIIQERWIGIGLRVASSISVS